MFNLKITHNNTRKYHEVPQANPLRWQVMFREKDVLSSQADPMKCRDFFNDIVAKYAGNENISIYGFNTADMKFNKFGLYFLLTNIHNADQFIGNLERTLLPKLKAQLKGTLRIYKVDNKRVVIRLPLVCLTKTFYMSLATIAVRLCNTNQDIQTWEELFDEKNPQFAVDNALRYAERTYARENGFELPEQLHQYWYWAGQDYNSKNGAKPITTVVHNNGIRNWVDYMKMTGVLK